MKYKIDGIEASETIKSTQVINTKNKKIIMVNYLDGTQDVFELNDDILNKIETMMNYQAQRYCKENDRYEALFSYKLFKIMLKAIAIVFGTASVVFIFNHALISTILSALATGIMVGLLARASYDEKYYLKYKLYLNSTMNKLQEYKDIIAKEKQLSLSKSKSNDCKINNIGDLDNVSYKYVKSIETKVDRYNAIDKQKTKTLENSSLY